jgi:hypothetical protein
VGKTNHPVVEILLAEFNETLRCEERADFTLLDRCPVEKRRELLALMNVAALAFRALEEDRRALRGSLSSAIAG